MTRQLDLLLINPGGRQKVYQGLQDADITAIETPVWCGLIAGFIRKHGFTAEILDANANEEVFTCHPRLIAIVCYGQQPSASTQTMTAANDLAHRLKNVFADLKIIMVGGHVAALPERTLEESGADYVTTGDGCHTILDLLQREKQEDVRGLGFYGEMNLGSYHGVPEGTAKVYFETHSAPNAEPAEMEMAWDLFDPSKYRCHNWQTLGTGWGRSPYAALYTSLGCPYKCSFCCIQAPFKEGDRATASKRISIEHHSGSSLVETANSYRLWPPDRIGQQIAALHYDSGVKVFKVADEMFVLNRRHVTGVCDAIQARITNAGDTLNIWAYARVDTANDVQLLAKMRSAGFRWLCLGIESASESVRGGVDKGYAQEKIAKCVERIKAAGIHVLANYIFGLPEDTLESMQQTLDMAVELNTPWANFYCFPAGTDVWTPDGFRKIEDMEVGDEVYGKNGITRVKNTGVRPADDIVEVKPRYLPAIRCTSEHPFWAAVLKRKHGPRIGGGKRAKGGIRLQRFEWVKAEDLRPFDRDNLSQEYHALVVDKRNFRREKTTLDLAPYVEGHIGEDRVGGQLNKIGQKYMEPWEVTEDLAELFGWYVAEGSIMSRKNKQVGFSLHKDETEHHARIQELILKCLGLKSRVLQASSENCVQITFTSKVWLRAVHDLFGENARTKRVPECVMNASDDVAVAFLKGYIKGDGTSWANAVGQMSCSTASLILGKQLMMLFLKIGVVPTYHVSKPRVKTWARQDGRNYESTTGPQAKLSWPENPTGKWKSYEETENCFLIPLRSVERCYGEEMVYNLETDDATFAIPEVVHNSAMPYPGSKLWDEHSECHNLPWSAFSQHSRDCTPLATKTLTSVQVLEFRDKAFSFYFTSARYLGMLVREFGTKAVKEVQAMTAYKLERNLLRSGQECVTAGT